MLSPKLFFIGIGIGILALGLGTESTSTPNGQIPQTTQLTDEMTVWEIFEKLGKIKLHKVDPKVVGFSAAKGEELVKQGFTTNEKGKKTPRQSKFFVCTSCHNAQRETDQLSSLNPQDRLDYAAKHKIPFLQGSTFFGIVNRVAFYNDDYQKKYGSDPNIKAANRDIRKAIQLCATQCAQGRPLEDWELESILAYFWTLELKVKDLNLNAEEKKKIEFALNESRSTARAVNIMESKYIDQYPAHFAEPMIYRTLQYDFEQKEKRMANGKNIYDLSCKHCHEGKRYSFFALDDSKASFRYLDKKMQEGHPHSLYKISRIGTYPETGKRAYMPQYTIEKMSDTQLEDLRIYVQEQAKK
jgi:mono/diheme cytochrome c family protein